MNTTIPATLRNLRLKAGTSEPERVLDRYSDTKVQEWARWTVVAATVLVLIASLGGTYASIENAGRVVKSLVIAGSLVALLATALLGAYVAEMNGKRKKAEVGLETAHTRMRGWAALEVAHRYGITELDVATVPVTAGEKVETTVIRGSEARKVQLVWEDAGSLLKVLDADVELT